MSLTSKRGNEAQLVLKTETGLPTATMGQGAPAQRREPDHRPSAASVGRSRAARRAHEAALRAFRRAPERRRRRAKRCPGSEAGGRYYSGYWHSAARASRVTPEDPPALFADDRAALAEPGAAPPTGPARREPRPGHPEVAGVSPPAPWSPAPWSPRMPRVDSGRTRDETTRPVRRTVQQCYPTTRASPAADKPETRAALRASRASPPFGRRLETSQSPEGRMSSLKFDTIANSAYAHVVVRRRNEQDARRADGEFED